MIVASVTYNQDGSILESTSVEVPDPPTPATVEPVTPTATETPTLPDLLAELRAVQARVNTYMAAQGA